MAEQNIEASPSDRVIKIPNNAANMEVDQSHAHVAHTGVDQGPAPVPSMSDLALAHLRPASPSQQPGPVAVENVARPMQQKEGFPTAPVAAMAPPRRMLLESAFRQDGDVKHHLPPVTQARFNMPMNRSLSESGGELELQQPHANGMPSYEDLLRQLAFYQQYALMQNSSSNAINAHDQYALAQQQQGQALLAMHPAYATYGVNPQNFSQFIHHANNYGNVYGMNHGTTYGQPNRPLAANPFSTGYGGLPTAALTPEQYQAMYYNQLAHANRLQTLTPTEPLASPSPEPEPAPKRKRGKRVSKAQIAAEDDEVAQLTDTAPKAKRGRKSTKAQAEDDTLETLEGETPAPKTKAKRGKKTAKAQPELNKNSKAWRVLQAKKLVDTDSIPASEYGWERGLLPVPTRIPTLEEIDAALDTNNVANDAHRIVTGNDGAEDDAMDVDPAHGGQLILAHNENELPSIHDGYIGKPPTALQSNSLFGLSQSLHRPGEWSFLTPSYTDQSEDSSDSSQSVSLTALSYGGLSQRQKYVKFQQYFMDHFARDEHVVASFNRVCRDYIHLERLREQEFYLCIYRLIYLFGPDELVEHFKGLLPNEWPAGAFKWIHDQISAQVNANRAASGAEDSHAILHAIEQGRESAAVTPASKKKKTSKNGFRAGDGGSPGDTDGVNGDLGEAVASDQAGVEVGTGSSQIQSSPPTATVMPSSATLADQVMLDAEDDDDKDADHEPDEDDSDGDEFVLGHDEFRGGRNKDKNKKKPSKKVKGTPTKPRASEFYASQIEHVGPVYKTRRAILTREDRPYICGLCGDDHRHPSDVAHHHGGSRESVMDKGCWAKHGKPKGEAAKWDRHGSCRVGLSDINYTKVKDGFVILDQDSWDRIESAVAMGRQYKLEHPKKAHKGSKVVEEFDDEEYGSTKKKGKGKKVAKAAPVVKTTKTTTPAEKKAVPQRKVVKAGADDEE